MSKMRNLIAIAISPLLLSSCAWFDFLHRYDAISEPPVKGGTDLVLEPRASTIEPSVRLPVAALQSAGNNAASKVLPFSASGRENLASWDLRDPIFHGCIFCGSLDADWSYTAGLSRPISVSGAQDRISITIPAGLNGRAGLAGDIANLFSLSGKNLSAQVEANLRTGFSADRRYCPAASGVTLDYRWLQGPEVEVIGQNCAFGLCVGPWAYNFAGSVDPEIRKRLPQMVAGLESAIPCEPVRDGLGKVWKRYGFPVELPYLGRMFVNVTPTALFIPGVRVDTQDLTFSGRLDAVVSLQSTAIGEEPLPLPENTAAPTSPGRFELNVPIETPYAALERLMQQAVLGRSYRLETPLGWITVRPKNIELYPSRDEVAIGIAFVLDYDRYLLGTSGTVWFAGKFDASSDGKRIQISKMAMTRKFTNPIWTIASALFEGEVQKAVADGFVLDLSQPLQDVESQVTAALSHSGEGLGVNVNASNVSIGVGRIATGAERLQVEGQFRATVQAAVEQVPDVRVSHR
jgi:hypothetical protein